jgi:molybdopterin molybdotransferase
MISVQEAESLILANLRPFGTEEVLFNQSHRRVLAEDLLADRDFPPFDRVMMDGIAINFEATQGQTIFEIEKTLAAGMPQASLENTRNCIEIMTGAILPQACDTVIRYEDLQQNGNHVNLKIEHIKQGQNVHLQGSDRKKGDIIVAAGKVMSAAEIGVLASIGKEKVLVKKKPIIVVISTGDELVSISTVPLPHQIRSSNGHAIVAALETSGASASYHHLPDNQALIESKIAHFLTYADAIVLSGGVSAGKFDFVPNALQNQGVRSIFHQVAQRPGKPMWFGVSPSNVAVFALPGNPVSTFMCLHRYVLPWIQASFGQKPVSQKVVLNENYTFKAPLTLFLPVSILSENGTLKARPKAGNGSGDLANLSNADGFIELPANQDEFMAGEMYRFIGFR